MASVEVNGQTRESLGSLRYKALQGIAKSQGVKANLSKAELINQLLKKVTSVSMPQLAGVCREVGSVRAWLCQ